MANPKSIIDLSESPIEIEDRVVRYDQLVSRIKQLEDQSEVWYDKKMQVFINELMISEHTPIKYNNRSKYGYKVDNTNTEDRLREYRSKVSKERNIRPYTVFSNKEMELLIETRPKTLTELIKIKGFGEYKVNTYGKDILNILNNNNRERYS